MDSLATRRHHLRGRSASGGTCATVPGAGVGGRAHGQGQPGGGAAAALLRHEARRGQGHHTPRDPHGTGAGAYRGRGPGQPEHGGQVALVDPDARLECGKDLQAPLHSVCDVQLRRLPSSPCLPGVRAVPHLLLTVVLRRRGACCGCCAAVVYLCQELQCTTKHTWSVGHRFASHSQLVPYPRGCSDGHSRGIAAELDHVGAWPIAKDPPLVPREPPFAGASGGSKAG
mmetsp:Transcript_41815/g.79899  ORF Transcript_41815/g.79899 Transcript_41815/m.79899 type:complete len:228 (-) Transcript_41815:2964-3647(-)